MLEDLYGRVVTNLRIAVTQRCNLDCIYCHREGEESSGKEISAERIVEIAKAFHELGVRKLKITGGEPLLRKDICDIISSLPEFDEISMTTNGTLLSKRAIELKESGLDRVNVSLDT
ncbi:MAG: radical SAM protein, partial [Archaeoglobaceae archaeon]